ncbi:MAG: hypothetical protein LW636_09360 [Planctomycetaceae bacterium]|nr:hypothetical protein [Planctomycetaceae bacterium]
MLRAPVSPSGSSATVVVPYCGTKSDSQPVARFGCGLVTSLSPGARSTMSSTVMWRMRAVRPATALPTIQMPTVNTTATATYATHAHRSRRTRLSSANPSGPATSQ